MFCYKCGANLPDDAAFCYKCGANVVEDNNIQNESTDAKINDTIGDSTETGNENGEDKTTESTYLWYYMQGNDRKGPVTEKQILDLAKTGSINRTSLVWKDGFTDWVIAEKTVLKYTLNSVLPPVPPEAVSDKWLWALATIPIFANIVLSRFIPTDLSILLTLIVVALNISFLTLDIKDLKKSGIVVESWIWVGFVLVPVYLFVRAAKTNKNKAPGIVWCVLFVLQFI
ncbi:MAG: GYF domain-containing protein [Lachnospiraceae bacterium]|nr:GYF domain-containing protein [Lachnospiraceae bacterium]